MSGQENLDEIEYDDQLEESLTPVDSSSVHSEEFKDIKEPSNKSQEVPITVKEYQQTLQELKEEISRLNKALDLKPKEIRPAPSEESIFKLKAMCGYAKQEVNEITAKIEEVTKSLKNADNQIESWKGNTDDDSYENIEDLNKKLKELEEEYSDLIRSNNDMNLADLDKILAPDANLKLVNEFFVNVQKRLGVLEAENAGLSTTLKKTSMETKNLREKCDKASSRYKSNDDLKCKLRDLEDTYMKYSIIEEKLMQDLKIAEEEYIVHELKAENRFDSLSAQKHLEELEAASKKDKLEIENLEFALQEKKNLLRASKAFGIQRSKTSNKLRTDMELLGLVLIEKDQMICKVKREIEEIKWKQTQIETELKEASVKQKIKK